VRLGILAALGAALAAALLRPAPAAAQLDVPLRPHLPWQTVETAHFSFHAPAELAPWTRRQAERMEAVRSAVARLVGFAPAERVHVLVEDPSNDANGSAYPFLRAPALFLWPVPPDPRSVIGEHRDWGELLLVHEYAHLAHLTRPSRNPRRRLLDALSPVDLGPVATRAPRWVTEGYATYVEGRLTGSGRPHGVWRPAVLRQWAIEGRLPSYAQVNGTGGPYGGSFAYLAGSAYFEWLVDRYAGARGDSVLPHLWRRLTARTPRGFDAAFAGVFPGAPAELYARWTAEVTSEAVAAERRLREAGVVEGRLVQRFGGLTGDPAVSRDGAMIALAVRPTSGPRRIVVLRTDTATRDTARARAREADRRRARARALDPEDVPAVEYLPRPLPTAATLPAVNGRAFDAPRFLPDGARLLLVRDEPRPDGVLRPDLWIWRWRTGELRRVTRGAAVRDADPSPDGRSALGTRCARGTCDVVRVDLATGAVSTVLAGDLEVVYQRPRWSPDGTRFVAVAHRDGRWRPVVASAAGGAAQPVGPDDADRYDADFLPDGNRLAVVSERGGAPNLELIDLATNAARTITRVTGAAVAPVPEGRRGTLLFLSMRSAGFHLHRLAPDSVPASLAPVPLTVASVDTAGLTGVGALAVVERPTEPAPTFATGEVRGPLAYGAGPRRYRLLPAGSTTADGESVVGALTSSDPAGRLTWVLQGGAGSLTTWRGGSLAAVWRGLRPSIDAQLFGASQRVAPRVVEDATDAAPPVDASYRGALLGTQLITALSDAALSMRAGASVGRLATDGVEADAGARALAFTTLRGGVTRGRGTRVATLSVGGHVTGGRTLDSGFVRAIGTAALSLRAGGAALRAEYLRGSIGRDAPAFERFAVGGGESPLVDAAVLSQRLPMPALPTGTIGGRTIETVRLTLPSIVASPYAWAARAPGAGGWHRLVGAEASLATLGIPFALVPGARVVGGAAYSLDEPLRRTWRGYLTITLRP
jgi:dipeptidyl aminopeptidase/acylaminoacyl peptidase